MATESLSIENKQRTQKIAGYFAAFVALGLASASLGPTLPDLQANTVSTVGQISYLFMGRSMGYLAGAVLGGQAYDRVPGHRVMALMLLVMAVMMVIVPLSSVLWVLLVAIFLLGMAEGAVDVGGNTLLVWIVRGDVTQLMNGLHFFWGVGAFLSPIIIAWIVLRSGDITWAYWTLAAVMIPVALWLARLKSPKAQVVKKDGSEGIVNRLLLGLLVAFLFLYVGIEVSYGGWILTYATTLGVADKTMAAYLTAFFYGALTAGRLLAIPIAARWRPSTMLLADVLGGLISVGIILLWRESIVAIWIGTIGLGVSMASVFPTCISLADRRMTITGQVTSWFFVGSSLGGMTIPWLIGQLFERVGTQVMMIVIFITLMVMFGVYMLVKIYAGPPIKDQQPS